ncbi:redoxin domain-containing protein [Echinicola salinicaeni]|uniref:redoxin domain-containing protein n=1 Tax=Echinicola salinicaeni TaxID=2762757 RepID=UPI0016460914|nr:redoxin domain-containing protein [Echinicola salinicaeni]
MKIKKTIFGLLLSIAILLTTYFICDFILDLSKDYSLWGFGALLGFILLLITIHFYYSKGKKFLPTKFIMFLAVFAVVFFIFMSAPSVRFATKVLPSYISFLLGVLAGAIYSDREIQKRHLYTSLLFLFPFFLNLNFYSSWVHFIEFGNISGKVDEKIHVPFEVQDINDNSLQNKDFEGKIVVFDFWFISCGPCWVKFPDLQKLHEKYKDSPQVEIYAVNRPMPKDKPNQLFNSIEEKGYTFPVLRGTQKVMDDFDIYVYPTIVVLDQEGNIAYMGKIEGVEEVIQKLSN